MKKTLPNGGICTHPKKYLSGQSYEGDENLDFETS
jgi:hypothetical protein